MARPRSKGRTSVPARKKGAVAADVDEYLARVPEPARSTLEAVRRAIRAAAPEATEAISYGVPMFRHFGLLVGFGAAGKHCALYGTTLGSYRKDLKAYDTSKGTIRFPPGAPPPSSLVRKIVKAHVAANEARAMRRARGSRPRTRRP